MIFFQRFYLDREKDLVVDLYLQGERMHYVIHTPNHHTGNLITNLARLCRHRESTLLAFDGNSAALNLIQQARNSSKRHRIYINPRSRGLTEKAKMLEGYVRVMRDAGEIVDE